MKTKEVATAVTEAHPLFTASVSSTIFQPPAPKHSSY
jgi:hypothetical protein